LLPKRARRDEILLLRARLSFVMEAPEEDLDAILNSTLEDMEKAEKQMPPPTPASVPATPTTTPTARPSSSTSAKTIEAFTEQLSNLMLDMSKENQDPEKLLKEIMKQLEAPEASSTPDVSSSSAVPDPVQANLMRTIASLAESAQKLAVRHLSLFLFGCVSFCCIAPPPPLFSSESLRSEHRPCPERSVTEANDGSVRARSGITRAHGGNAAAAACQGSPLRSNEGAS
jgi:hypothetical protein